MAARQRAASLSPFACLDTRTISLMKQRQLGPYTVSAIGLGCMNLSHAYGAPPAPEVGEALIHRALEGVQTDLLWVNPDCGLKTRGYNETVQSLKNLVEATKRVRATL